MPPANHYMCDGVTILAYTRQGARNDYNRKHGRDPLKVDLIWMSEFNGDH